MLQRQNCQTVSKNPISCCLKKDTHKLLREGKKQDWVKIGYAKTNQIKLMRLLDNFFFTIEV